MDIDKEREAFEKLHEIAERIDGWIAFRGDRYWNKSTGYVDQYLTGAWYAWQAAKAQAVPEWISVDDEPPTSNKTFSDAVIAWDGLCIRRIPLCLFKSTSEVTHWMPIPQPPKAQEQKG